MDTRTRLFAILALATGVIMIIAFGIVFTEELETPISDGLLRAQSTVEARLDERTLTPESVLAVTEMPARFLWVLDDGDRAGEFRVIKMTSTGEILWEVKLGQAESISLLPDEGSIWTTELNDPDGNEDQLVKLDSQGNVLLRLDGYRAEFLAADPLSGRVWIGLPNEDMIVYMDPNGRELNWAPGFEAPASLTVDPRDGSLIVADSGGENSASLTKLNQYAREVFRINTPGFFSDSPQQVAIDPADGSIWYTGARSGEVFKVNGEGEALASAGNFDRPVAISVDPSDGSVWVADFSVDTTGGVVKLDALGNFITRVDLSAPPETATVDPYDGGVWVGIEGALVRLSSSGELVMTLDSFNHPEAIVIEPYPEVVSSRPAAMTETQQPDPTIDPSQVLRQIPMPSDESILDVYSLTSGGQGETVVYSVLLNAQAIRDFYTIELDDLSWERVFSDEGFSTISGYDLPTAGMDFRRGEDWLAIAVVEDTVGLLGEFDSESSVVFASMNMSSGDLVLETVSLLLNFADEVSSDDIEVDLDSMRFISNLIKFDHPSNWIATRTTLQNYTTGSQEVHDLESNAGCPIVDPNCFVNFYLLENTLYRPTISIRRYAIPDESLEEFELQHWNDLRAGSGGADLQSIIRPEQLSAPGSSQSLDLNTVVAADGTPGLQRIYSWRQRDLSIPLVSSYTLFSHNGSIFEFRSDFTETEWETYAEIIRSTLATIEFPVEEEIFVCAAYVRNAGSIDFTKHTWTGEVGAIASLRGCFEWAEQNILNATGCGRPTGERVIVALLDIDRLYDLVPEDLDMSTEFVTSGLCLP